MTLKVVYCSICGQGSTRADWQDGKPHQCDSHASQPKAPQATAKPVETPPPAVPVNNKTT